MAGHTDAPRPWRDHAAITIIVLGCVIAIPAMALGWVNRQLTDTAAYTKTVAPLIDNPQVQRVITDKVTTAIFDHIDRDKLVNSGIDAIADAGANDRVIQVLDGLADPIEGAIEGLVSREVAKVVASDTTARLWREINEVSHAELAAALAGDDTRTLQIHGNELVADIGILSGEVKRRLAERGLGLANLLPTINTEITLVDSPQIAQAQDRYQLLTFLGSTLPWLAAALIIGGLLLAIRRRQALVVAGVGVAVAMVVLGIALWISRGVAADSIPSRILPSSTSLIVIDTLLRSIWRPMWVLVALGGVAALAAYLAGPAALAQQFRKAVNDLIVAGRRVIANRGWRLTPVDSWARKTRLPLLVAVVGIAAIVLLVWSNLTWQVVLWTSAISALVALVIAFIAAEEPPASTKHSAKKASAPERAHRKANTLAALSPYGLAVTTL